VLFAKFESSHEQAAKADMAARFMSTRPTLASILAKARPGILKKKKRRGAKGGEDDHDEDPLCFPHRYVDS
jgi:hypothetical protein